MDLGEYLSAAGSCVVIRAGHTRRIRSSPIPPFPYGCQCCAQPTRLTYSFVYPCVTLNLCVTATLHLVMNISSIFMLGQFTYHQLFSSASMNYYSSYYLRSALQRTLAGRVLPLQLSDPEYRANAYWADQ